MKLKFVSTLGISFSIFLISFVFKNSVMSQVSNLIQNGGFETSKIDPGSFTELPKGSKKITNWKVTKGTIDYKGTYWVASEGARSVDLSGSSAGGISQSFSTLDGQVYQVLFDMAGNPDGSPTRKKMNVKASGLNSSSVPWSAIQAFTFDTTGHSDSDMGWMTQSWCFQAQGTTTTLSFISRVSSFYGPALDNVSVVPVASCGALRTKRTKSLIPTAGPNPTP